MTQRSTFYALFIPTRGRHLILFPEINHTLISVPTLEECPAAARQFLKNHLVRHIIDREPFPITSDMDTCSQNALEYIRRVGYPLEGDVPIYPVTIDREALDRIATQIETFRAENPGEDVPISPEVWNYITKD